jgi:hypothetical protein
MSDETRQGKPKFEPPPWEKEAFEALAVRRAEQEAANRAIAEAAEVGDESPMVTRRPAAEASGSGPADGGQAGVVGPPAQQGGVVAKPDRETTEEMLLQLAREERSDNKGTQIVAWVAAGVTAVLGSAVLIAGISIATRSGGKVTALIGSAVLTVVGLSFIGMSVWVWVGASRVRGR